MGGLIGFTLSIILIVILFRKVFYSNIDKNLKVFLALLFSVQTMFENFNTITALGSYLLIWVLLAENGVNNTLKKKKQRIYESSEC